MTSYPIPDNLTTIIDLGTYSNQVTEGIFGTGFLLVLFVVMFLRFHGFRETKASLLGSSMITFIVAVFFRMLGWVNDLTLYVCVILVIIFILMQKFDT